MVGFIKDYRRVFDLACIDHRDTPENPAKTCTLEPKGGAVCVKIYFIYHWGTAYCVRGGPEKEKLTMQCLERRECEYDQKILVDFYKVLELGIVLHSVIIGLSLGVSQSPCTIRPLIAALSFQQFFEGFALGGCISQAQFKASSATMIFVLTLPMMRLTLLPVQMKKLKMRVENSWLPYVIFTVSVYL